MYVPSSRFPLILGLPILGMVVICFIFGSFSKVANATQSKELAAELKTLSLDQLRSEGNRPDNTDRIEFQLEFLKRLDAPLDERYELACSIIEEYKDQNQPRILALALSAKATTFEKRGNLQLAVETLEEAEKYGLECVADAPEIFFVARSNRALYMVSMGNRAEPATLLREAIEFAEPYGDRLSIDHTYITLAHLAEASGANDKALEYCQKAFEIATRADRANMAGAAGDTIVALLYGLKEYELAREWVDRALPWVEKATDKRVKYSFTMRREELRAFLGDPTTAATNLRSLIENQSTNMEAQIVGLAYLALSAAELANGNNDAGLAAAEKAIENLGRFGRSLYLAQCQRLEALLAKGDAEVVASEIAAMLPSAESFTLPKIRLLEIQSRALGKLGRSEEALAALRASIELDKTRVQERAKEQMRFINALHDEQKRKSELALLKEREKGMMAASELSQAQAASQQLSAEFARKVRNITVVVSLATVVSIAFLLWSHYHRQSAVLLSERKKELNEQLSEKLTERESELKSEVEARRKLEVAIERKQRMEALGKLTGGVAHDFNNLLTVILNTNELIRIKEKGLSPVMKEFLDSSTKAAQSGASIISQLLAYARQQPLAPKPTKVSDWLRSVQNLFQKTVGSTIQYSDIDETQGQAIRIDSAQLTTSIINLLFNARDAIDKSGEITLAISTITIDSGNAKEWSDVEAGEYVQFEVRDNGSGIPAEEIEHVCEPFYTTKGANAGTGLGLSSVLGFVKQSSGDLQLESQVGRGTTVRFIIPVCEWNERDSIAKPTLPSQPQKNRMLVVDDQEEVRKVTVEKLQMMGFEVDDVDSADEVVRVLESGQLPDVILSDIRMPGSMNGIELRRWISARFPNIRVILMSGYHDLEEDSQSDFLQKPFSQKELEKALVSSDA